jgi:hypothetical protein
MNGKFTVASARTQIWEFKNIRSKSCGSKGTLVTEFSRNLDIPINTSSRLIEMCCTSPVVRMWAMMENP